MKRLRAATINRRNSAVPTPRFWNRRSTETASSAALDQPSSIGLSSPIARTSPSIT
jgi:hypothetical protein